VIFTSATCPILPHDDRVVVHVDNPRLGVDLPRDLVHGTLRGQPHADVENWLTPASAARNRTTRNWSTC
jgi:hypothetical protein